MPADVNGTINIIAEVVGRSQSPSNNANVLEGRTAQETEKNRRGFLGLALDGRKIKLVMFGLLAQSKIIGTTLQTTFRLIGILVDVFLMPFIPILQDGMGFFSSIVTFTVKLMNGDWSGIWNDLKDWWYGNWEEGGGLVGIIKAVLSGATGTAALTALIATMFMGPRAGIWVLQNTFGLALKGGYLLSKNFIGKLMGWTSTLFRGARGGGGSVLKTVGNVLLNTAGLLKKLFWKVTPVWGQTFLKNAWGLLKWTGKKLTGTAANLVSGLWKSKLLRVGKIGVTSVLGWVGALMAKLGIGAFLSGAAAGLGFFFLLSLVTIGAVVGGMFVLNALSNAIWNKGLMELDVFSWISSPSTYLQFNNAYGGSFQSGSVSSGSGSGKANRGGTGR